MHGSKGWIRIRLKGGWVGEILNGTERDLEDWRVGEVGGLSVRVG
jgi:hypothetical protein